MHSRAHLAVIADVDHVYHIAQLGIQFVNDMAPRNSSCSRLAAEGVVNKQINRC